MWRPADDKGWNPRHQMKDEYGKPVHSEKFLEMAFSNGKLRRTVSQFGKGIPSAVEATLAGRATAANNR